jgi:hypothetical protein
MYIAFEMEDTMTGDHFNNHLVDFVFSLLVLDAYGNCAFGVYYVVLQQERLVIVHTTYSTPNSLLLLSKSPDRTDETDLLRGLCWPLLKLIHRPIADPYLMLLEHQSIHERDIVSLCFGMLKYLQTSSTDRAGQTHRSLLV